MLIPRPPNNLTLQHLPDGRYKLRDGTAADHGLRSSVTHSFDMPDGTTIVWTVDCGLTGEQVRAIAIALLGNFEFAPLRLDRAGRA